MTQVVQSRPKHQKWCGCAAQGGCDKGASHKLHGLFLPGKLRDVVLLAQVVELIKRTPRESRPGDFIPDSGTLQGSLELQNVVFAYPGRPTQRVLNGLNLAVSPGARCALGLTGGIAVGLGTSQPDASAELCVSNSHRHPE
jgi:ABC-type multidrug transport system fused ATPase/permease subunit